jgi:hypothetical protein
LHTITPGKGQQAGAIRVSKGSSLVGRDRSVAGA